MNPKIHLTDEQMYDLLDPAANTVAQPHLQNCGKCQAEVANLRESLANFRGAVTHFAAEETPKFAPAVARATSWFVAPKVWAASFATATALLAVSIAVLHPVHNNPAKNVADAAPKAVLTNESDDALLDGIQQDLSTSIPPSLEPLAVPATSSETSTHN